MKNENESKEEIEKSNSSTSDIIETVDLSLRPTASLEPNLLLSKPSGSSASPNVISKQNAVVAVKDIFDRVLDEAFQAPTTSGQHFLESSPPPLYEDRNINRQTISQPNLRRDIQVMKCTGGLVNSTNAMHNENFVNTATLQKNGGRIPPSYSTVLKLGPFINQFDSRTFPSIPFITRQPPPSYAEVHGGWDENQSVLSADSFALGPNPLYVSCPRCRTIVVSDIHSERSQLSTVASILLCVFMCWPCCLLPFCLKSCRNTYHFCPTCHYYFGVYRPC